MRPRPIAQPHPRIYLGGESDAAKNLAMQAADVFFLNGRPLEVVRETVADVRNRKRTLPKPLRFALSAFVIARPTDAEAQAEYEYLFELSKQDDRTELLKGVEPEVVMFKNMAKYPGVGSNGGTAAGLVGSYDTVAAKIADFVAVGIDTFMLQFQPFVPEMKRFSQEVVPRVRSLKLAA